MNVRTCTVYRLLIVDIKTKQRTADFFAFGRATMFLKTRRGDSSVAQPTRHLYDPDSFASQHSMLVK